MITTLAVRCLVVLGVLLGPAVLAGEFEWPGGAKAAVVLTYDDGIDVHLDRAAPDLEAVNLRGTFYVPGQSESLANRLEEWRVLAERGHELGNHTVFHPCLLNAENDEVRDWLKPEYHMESYTARRYVNEAKANNTTLRAVDGRPSRTFAYTCCDLKAGGESVVDGLRPLFPAARWGGEPDIVTDLRGQDLFLVPSWMVEGATGQEMIDFVQRAVRAGGIAVIMFHGIDGPFISVSRQAHQELLAWLDAHRNDVWTDTFLNVMNHVISERKRLGWE